MFFLHIFSSIGKYIFGKLFLQICMSKSIFFSSHWGYYSNEPRILHRCSKFKSFVISVFRLIISRKFIEPHFYPDCARKERACWKGLSGGGREREWFTMFSHDNSYAPTMPRCLFLAKVRYALFVISFFARETSAGSPWTGPGRCILSNLLAKIHVE